MESNELPYISCKKAGGVSLSCAGQEMVKSTPLAANGSVL